MLIAKNPCDLVEAVDSMVFPVLGVLKFIVDGASRGELGLAGIGGVLWNAMVRSYLCFSKNVGVWDSNEVEVLAILEDLMCF